MPLERAGPRGAHRPGRRARVRSTSERAHPLDLAALARAGIRLAPEPIRWKPLVHATAASEFERFTGRSSELLGLGGFDTDLDELEVVAER